MGTTRILPALAALAFTAFVVALLPATGLHDSRPVPPPDVWERTPQPAPHECRFWALIGSGYDPTVIQEHLRAGAITNLRRLASWNRDGWGFSSWLDDEAGLKLDGPLIRRGGPPADHEHDPDYDRAVQEIARLKPRAVIGHVRAGSSGHWGLPNPHPFEHEGLTFAHNGTISVEVLLDLLTQGDREYFQRHPTEYVNGYIDSELYFMYLLRARRDHPELRGAEAWRRAIRLLSSRVPDSRLNFVMTDGDTLYALRCAGYDFYDAVRYFPASAKPDPRPLHAPWWVVASEVVGSTESGWGEIPARTLAVLAPGRPAEFIPIDESGGDGAENDPPQDPEPAAATVAAAATAAAAATIRAMAMPMAIAAMQTAGNSPAPAPQGGRPCGPAYSCPPVRACWCAWSPMPELPSNRTCGTCTAAGSAPSMPRTRSAARRSSRGTSGTNGGWPCRAGCTSAACAREGLRS